MAVYSAVNVAALQSLPGVSQGDVAVLDGYYNAGDGGGGLLYFEGTPAPSSATVTGALLVSIGIVGATNASPIVVTTGGAHGFVTNQCVKITGVTGNTNTNGDWVITVVNTTQFALNHSAGSGTYLSGGTAQSVTITTAAGHGLAAEGQVIIAGATWAPPASGINGTWTKIGVIDRTHFSIAPTPGATGNWISGGIVGDGGMSIPSTAINGRWGRGRTDSLNVKWFGAKGDNSQNDAPFIQNAINVAQAHTLTTNAGNTVVIPPGQYKLVATAGSAALSITGNNVCLIGAGGPPGGGTQLLVVGSGAADCGILIEETTTAMTAVHYTQLRNLSIVGQSPAPRDLIVVHANNVTIADCYLAICSRYGIMIESNTLGSQIFGITSPSVVTNIISDTWRLSNVQLVFCSDFRTGEGNLANGAAVYVHGSDTNGGFATGVVANDCNISFVDLSPAGGTWVGCYSQSAKVGYITSANEASFVGCNSEDEVVGQFAAGFSGAIIAGTLKTPNMTRLARQYSQKIETEDRTGPTALQSRLDLQDGRSFHTWNAVNHSPVGWYWGDQVGANFPTWYALSHNGNNLRTGLAMASESATDAQPGDLWISGLNWWLGPGAGLQAIRMRVTYGTSAPTSGSFKQGDICINIAPTASGPGAVHLWRCVVGGTPGTWAKVALT